MKPQLNHLIVWATDRRAAANHFAEVTGMGKPTEYGHFTQVETGNGVTLDFADGRGRRRERRPSRVLGDRAPVRRDLQSDRGHEDPLLGRPWPIRAGSHQPPRRRTRRLLQRPAHQCRLGNHHATLRLRPRRLISRRISNASEDHAPAQSNQTTQQHRRTGSGQRRRADARHAVADSSTVVGIMRCAAWAALRRLGFSNGRVIGRALCVADDEQNAGSRTGRRPSLLREYGAP